MKIAIIGCYYNIESYKCMMDALSTGGNTVDFFPMLYYYHNDRNNLEKDFVSFLDGKSSNDKIIVNKESSKNPVQVIIWRCYLAPPKIFQIARERQIINVLYNCTDPFETMEHNLRSSNLAEILPYFDAVFTTSKKSIEVYGRYGIKHVHHTTMAIDPLIHKPFDTKIYDADVSFVLNSLYLDNPHGLDRKKIIDRVARIPNVRLKIYGPALLREFYPNNYVEEISYDQSARVFSSSKINLNTHHVNPKDNGDSLNERTYQILASGGLMLADIDDDSFLCSDCFIKLDEVNLETQIKDILDRYDTCSAIRGIKKRAESSSKKFSFKTVMTSILSQIKKDFFKNNYSPTLSAVLPSSSIDKKRLLDRYAYQSEIITLIQAIMLIGPSKELFDQMKLLSDIEGIDINKFVR